jgi:hypothetical protein
MLDYVKLGDVVVQTRAIVCVTEDKTNGGILITLNNGTVLATKGITVEKAYEQICIARHVNSC